VQLRNGALALLAGATLYAIALRTHRSEPSRTL